MNNPFFPILLSLLMYLILPLIATAQVVDIPDSNLRTVVEKALGKASGATITAADMARLSHLQARNANITNLTGIQHATNLTRLDLGAEWVEAEGELVNSNSASNLSPLAGLTNLTWLNLEFTFISDISDLAGLTNLTELWLEQNRITDISPVAGLTNLTRLEIGDNNISNLSPLAGLTNLKRLRLRHNRLSDISALAGLTNLTWLNLEFTSISGISALAGLTNLTDLLLYGNSISDISPLAGLTNLTRLGLARNNLSNISPLASLTNLTRLGLARNNLSNISPLAGLTNLATLGLADNNLSDISPLVGLINLTRLGLRGNNISNISAVAGLNNLAALWLQNNWISDLSPLVANMGLGSGDTIDVRGNRLSAPSLHTHIPTLQSRGVTVEFDNRLPRPDINTNGMVRVVYFLPSDRPARPDRVAALSKLIKNMQQFFAEQMHRHGFGGKTFTVETDNNGEPLVHQINGKFREEYYDKEKATDFAVWEELLEHFDDGELQHVYFIAIDLSSEALNDGTACGLGGLGFYPTQGDIGYGPAGKPKLRHRHPTIGEEVHGGFALIPASGNCFGDGTWRDGALQYWGATLHELGHALGLEHDFREGIRGDSVMASPWTTRLSKCAAEWLSVSRFFNTKLVFRNEPGEIQLLSLQTYSQEAINFRFKVTDPDGLYQAQLLVPDISNGTGWAAYRLFDCKRLSGTTSTVESTVRTAELLDRITLQIIDVGGNITWATFPIQLDEAVAAQNVLDVNSDGVVNILDLTHIASRFGQQEPDSADVNGDRVVDIVDLLMVAGNSSSVSRQAAETFTSVDVQQWLTAAKQLDVENETLVKGIILLEYLLAEVALLSKPIETTTGPLKAIFAGHTDHVWSVAFSPDGGTLASGSWDGTIRLWSTNTAQHKNTLIGHTTEVTSVVFSPDGQMLASGSADRTIRLWNPNTGKLKTTLAYHDDGVRSIAFSPDGQILASGGGPQRPILLWNAITWQVERMLTGHTDGVTVVAFAPDGNTLASGSRDETIRLWNSHTGEHIRVLAAPSSVNRLAFSPDGDTLASGNWDKTISLWNPHTGKLKRSLPNQGGWVNPVTFSPDGGTLVIGNRGISLWDLETGQYKTPLTEDIGDAVSVVFSSDGTMLASGSADNLVRLWDFTPFLITPGLSKISGDNQTGVSGVILANPFVIAVRDENLSTLEGISVTFTVTAGGGTLSVTHTTTDKNGRAESTLTLGPNLRTNTVSVFAAGIEGTVTFNTTAEAAVDIPDANLRAAIEDALDKDPGTPIAPADIAALTRIEARGANISDLTGLESATNLQSLDLGYGGAETSHAVKDLSPLAGLTQLTSLHLPGKSISDISAVAGLTNLTWLNLEGNSVSDISALVVNTGLGNRTQVYVWGNPLSYQSIHTHIPTLQSRGVTIYFDNQAHPALLKISGDSQNGASLAPLSQPFVVEAQDTNGSALAGISVRFVVTAGSGTLSTTSTRTNANGRAQSTLTLGPNLGTNTVSVSATGIEVPATFHAISDTESPSIAADVNSDGNVNVLDLVVIASELGNAGTNLAVDVNGDGAVNVLDLILVAGMFDGAAAAPSAQPQVPETLTAVEVQGWLTDARTLEVRDPIMKRGFVVLEQLLIALTPKETELLANYPNPFNPETWIPYRLAEDAFVTLTIYNTAGRIVRTFDVGHRIASAYENRSKVIYWDGRNDIGEGVASGVYFYTLSAGDYSATRRMVILK